MRTTTFAKVGAVKATENTDSSCIISSDGLGMASSWACSYVKLTLPQVVHAFPSTLKMGKVQVLIDGLKISPHEKTFYSDGRLHPNIDGFAYIAERLAPILTSALKN
jgi:hypothetical protein